MLLDNTASCFVHDHGHFDLHDGSARDAQPFNRYRVSRWGRLYGGDRVTFCQVADEKVKIRKGFYGILTFVTAIGGMLSPD